MSAPNYETMCKDVFDFLDDAGGEAYSLGYLAGKFKISKAGMNVVLAKLGNKIEFTMKVTSSSFYIPTPTMLQERQRLAEQRNNKPNRTHAKEYVQPKAMTAALERCKELYPAGRGFISIS